MLTGSRALRSSFAPCALRGQSQRATSRNEMPMKTKMCTFFGKCAYYDVCYLPPEQRQTLLESNLFEENHWTPLKQPSAE